MSTTRTKFGLKLTCDNNGEWRGPDDIRIGRVRALELCEVPHPKRERDVRTGRVVTGYCPGNQEHDHEVGWDIRQYANGGAPREMNDDLYPTLTEAWEALAKHLARVRT